MTAARIPTTGAASSPSSSSVTPSGTANWSAISNPSWPLARARWSVPKRSCAGPIPAGAFSGPAEFVALAEQAGLVSRLSRTVLAYALGECRMWHEAGHEISVAVNLAVSDLLDATLPDRVAGLLAAHGLRPESLVLEITEDAIMVDPDRVGAIVAELRSFGVGFSVDDYGTGYSSLSYLRDLPIQELKIDRSFVTGISGSAKDQAIVAATVSLARSLGVRLVAEGVETLADWDHLRRLGVEVAQGYAISRPKCAPHFSAWLAGCSQLVGRGGLPGISDVFQPADLANLCRRPMQLPGHVPALRLVSRSSARPGPAGRAWLGRQFLVLVLTVCLGVDVLQRRGRSHDL